MKIVLLLIHKARLQVCRPVFKIGKSVTPNPAPSVLVQTRRGRVQSFHRPALHRHPLRFPSLSNLNINKHFLPTFQTQFAKLIQRATQTQYCPYSTFAMSDQDTSATTGAENANPVDPKGKAKAEQPPQDMSMDENESSSEDEGADEVRLSFTCAISSY